MPSGDSKLDWYPIKDGVMSEHSVIELTCPILGDPLIGMPEADSKIKLLPIWDGDTPEPCPLYLPPALNHQTPTQHEGLITVSN